jgi:hypothetical protein
MSQNETLKFEEPSELKIPVPWGHVAAKAWGDPSKRPVLAMHGWMGTFIS